MAYCGFMETWKKLQMEKNARTKKRDKEEGVEITIWANEMEKEGNAEKPGLLCIRKAMQQRILHESCGTTAEGHFGADRTYLHMKDQYFFKQMLHDIQRCVAGYDICHQTNHRSGKPIGILSSLPIGKSHWQRIGLNFVTDLLTSEKDHDSIVTFVDHMIMGAHWRACKKTINAPSCV